MSRIEELVERLCPDGVAYKNLGKVARIVGGRDYKHLGEGSVPVYGSGGLMTYVDTAAYDKPTVLLPRKGSISNVFYLDEPFWNVDTVFYTVIDESQMLPRFFYHVVLNEHIEKLNTSNAARPALTRTVLDKIRIPVPPLEIQQEIVRVLDSFAELEVELEVELEARNRQYAYYRNELLNHADNELVPVFKLGDISTIGTGSHDTKDGQSEGAYTFYARGVETMKLDEYDYDETAIITAGDGAGVGKVIRYAVGKYALHQRAYRIRPNAEYLAPRYLYHYFCSTFYDYIMKQCVNSSVASIRRKMLDNYEIPVPPLQEQERIVAILDKFDTLVNDITIGIPAEIEARRKQYEYYRDKLLSFKEKVA